MIKWLISRYIVSYESIPDTTLYIKTQLWINPYNLNGKFHIDTIISNFIENIFHFLITKDPNTSAYELFIILLLAHHDRVSMIDCTNLIFFKLHSDEKHLYTNKIKIKTCKTGTQNKTLEITIHIFVIFFVKIYSIVCTSVAKI